MMIETINIWRRNHDGKYSICVLYRLGLSDEIFSRKKYTVDNLNQVSHVVASLTNFLKEDK